MYWSQVLYTLETSEDAGFCNIEGPVVCYMYPAHVEAKFQELSRLMSGESQSPGVDKLEEMAQGLKQSKPSPRQVPVKRARAFMREVIADAASVLRVL